MKLEEEEVELEEELELEAIHQEGDLAMEDL